MGALQIDLLDTSFAIKASEDDEYLKKLLDYYKRYIEQIQQSGTLENPLQISILAGVMLCDELFKAKNGEVSVKTNFDIVSEKVEKLTLDMIKKIDSVLEND